MSKNIYISAVHGRKRVALTENGELIEFHTERDSSAKIVGNIYKGQVVNVLSGMQAAFVNIGLIKNAFLYVGELMVEKEDMPEELSQTKLRVSEGDEVMIQVVKDQMGTKGARVTTDISLPGRLMVLMPSVNYVGISKKITDEMARERLHEIVSRLKPPEMGFVIRTAAEHATEAEIKADIEFLLESYSRIQKKYEKSKVTDIIHEEGDLIFRTIRDMFTEDVDKIYVNDRTVYEQVKCTVGKISPGKNGVVEIFESESEMFSHFGLMEQIEGLLERKVPLKNGAYLIIDKTEALTIIDINTGKYIGTSNLEETVFNTNMLAAVEIARQIRLRNIGGIIICDFIDMVSDEHREAVLKTLSEVLQKDRIRTSMLGMTGLGLVEITRKKTHNEISSVLLQTCPYCQGDGAIHSSDFLCFKIRAQLFSAFKDSEVRGVVLFTNPTISDFIFKSRYFTQDIENKWAEKRIYIVTEPMRHIENFHVSLIKTAIFDLPEGARLVY